MFGNNLADPRQIAHVLDLRIRLNDAVARAFDLPDITRCLKVNLEMDDLPAEIEDFCKHHFKEILDSHPDIHYSLDGKPVVSYRIWGAPQMRRYCLHHLTLEIAKDGTIKTSLLAEFKTDLWSEEKDVELPVKKIRAELLPEGWPNSAIAQTNEP